METMQIPPLPLERPLVFGDAEQIAALKILKDTREEEEKVDRQQAEGILKKYRVSIEFTGAEDVDVLATSEVEATLLGEERIEVSSANIDIENAHAKEL